MTVERNGYFTSTQFDSANWPMEAQIFKDLFDDIRKVRQESGNPYGTFKISVSFTVDEEVEGGKEE